MVFLQSDVQMSEIRTSDTKKRFCNAGKKEYAILWIGGIDWIFSSSPAYFLYLFF